MSQHRARLAPGLALSQATHASSRDPVTAAASNARPAAPPSRGSALPPCAGPEPGRAGTARGRATMSEKVGAARTARSRVTSSQPAAVPRSIVPGASAQHWHRIKTQSRCGMVGMLAHGRC